MTLVAVPIHGDAIAVATQAEAARAAGADLVEVLIDRCVEQGADPDAVVAGIGALALPAIATARSVAEGGAWHGAEARRQALLAEADRRGAAYVDVELAAIAAGGPWTGWTPSRARLVLSHHDHVGMGSDLPGVIARMRAVGASMGGSEIVAKVAVMARDAADLATIRDLYVAGGGPLVAIAMGEHGLPSRLLSGVWGAEFTFARMDSGHAGSAPGQPTVRDLLRLYRLKGQSDTTRVFGVIGSPIAHSLSPLVHNAALGEHGLDAVYVPFRVEDAAAFWRACGGWLEGLSITIPHKQALLAEVDGLEELADSIAAMNTIYRDDADGAVGANTDAGAIVRCLEIALGRIDARRILVLGAGGVARTAAFACRARGAEVVIANRTAARAVELAAEAGCEAIDWRLAEREPYDVLINGTSVGMGKPDESPWPAAAHRSGTVVFDTVYTPLETRLLRDAQAAGASTICGLDMFIGQAVGQFERWTGLPAPEHLMYRLALERLDPAGSSGLTGQWRRRSTSGG